VSERIGTEAEQSTHRPPAPSPAEHNATFDRADENYATTAGQTLGQITASPHTHGRKR